MSNRWHMNRMGFVNFWLYDEEIFLFASGKLLLRGQNGSGKSITTQSFIPFILDGDRSPNRLDPFGSSDRRMEYYFLGESGEDESTGYLFLEFKRENIEQYRTIAIGQRAQRGKPMAFWGFIILDGRRIGYDMNLYREVGTRKIPYTKQELKQQLGDDNPYTEVQREYMELVNKHIFGFASPEQYGQYIRLLIKVRAPKLSKEFKPTKVYEILNESLQTLSDEDLRAMVEAMEKMDDIQNRLQGLKSAFKDMEVIRREYLRYNLYMLGKKAQGYVEEKKKVDGTRGHLEQKTDEIKGKDREILEREECVRKLEDEMHILKSEKETLHGEDLETSINKLRETIEEKKEVEADQSKWNNKIEQSRGNIRIYDGELRSIQGNIDLHLQETKDILQELAEENQIVRFQLHNLIHTVANSRERKKDIQELVDAIKILEKDVEQGYTVLNKRKEAQLLWDTEEEKLQKLLAEKEAVEIQCRDAQALENECRDQIIEKLYTLASKNQELHISKSDLEKMVQEVQRYENPSDFSGIRNCIDQNWREKDEKLRKSKISIENQIENSNNEKKRLVGELEAIEQMEIATPKQSLRTEQARKILKEKGITFLPFYETVDFAPEVTQEIKNRVEGQLADAGILDALIILDSEYEWARRELKGLSDVLIRPHGVKNNNRYPYLTTADIQSELKKESERVLHYIFETNQQGAVFVLSADGYFKNGILEGCSHVEEEASYIGADARKQKKERLIQEKKEEVLKIEEDLYTLNQGLKQIKLRISILKQERENMPSFVDLDQAIEMLRNIREQLKKYTKFAEEQEGQVWQLKEKCKHCEQQVIKVCKLLPYTRTPEAYQEVLFAVRQYREGLGELERTLSYLDMDKSNYSHKEEFMRKEEEIIDETYSYLRNTERRIRVLEGQIQSLNEYLDQPQIREMAERLKKITGELNVKAEQFRKHNERLAVLRDNKQKLKDEIVELRKIVTEQIKKETKLQQYFAEELSLGLVMKQESYRIYDAAVKAQSLIKEGDKYRSDGDMTTSLMRTFHSHLGTLTSYGTVMEECFESDGEDSALLRKRQRIAATWNGNKLYLEEFYHVIKESIDGTELLIQQKDRDLFEGILADTLSRKLSSRIRESRSWIKDMSVLMQSMDTSMALTFSLDWRSKKAEGEKELDTQELEKILMRERDLLTPEDIDKVSAHFRTKIDIAKRSALENGEAVNYMDMVRDALDYRKWFEFRMNYYRNNENKKELTNGAFNRFSGGEKAMAMYVPLFAAVNAQYKKAQNQDHPRIIALDEAFAGVDDKNISSMFELVQKLDFDYIMNSQVLWGCYETVRSLRIAELLRPANSDVVTAIYYYWNGQERILDEQ